MYYFQLTVKELDLNLNSTRRELRLDTKDKRYSIFLRRENIGKAIEIKVLRQGNDSESITSCEYEFQDKNNEPVYKAKFQLSKDPYSEPKTILFKTQKLVRKKGAKYLTIKFS